MSKVRVPESWVEELKRQYERLVKSESKPTLTFEQFVENVWHLGMEKLRNMGVVEVLKIMEKIEKEVAEANGV